MTDLCTTHPPQFKEFLYYTRRLKYQQVVKPTSIYQLNFEFRAKMKSNFNSASGLRPPPLPPEFSPESNWGEERFQVRLDVGRAAREEEIRVGGGAHDQGCQMAKFDAFLSLDCTGRRAGGAIKGKEGIKF